LENSEIFIGKPLKMTDTELITALTEAVGFQIDRVEHVEDNWIFESLAREAPLIERRDPLVKNFLNVTTRDMMSVVRSPEEAVVKVHKSIDYQTFEGSILRFSSLGDEGLELTRIQVPEESRRKGMASLLMEMAFIDFSIILGYTPEMMLECTGIVGIGSSEVSVGISAQVEFFRRQGFEIEKGSCQEGYVRMTRQADYHLDPPSPEADPPYARPYPPTESSVYGDNSIDLPF
jgi:GNAT superfamily N-acetyltransferase